MVQDLRGAANSRTESTNSLLLDDDDGDTLERNDVNAKAGL